MSRETFRAMGAEVAVVGASKAELAAVTRLFDEWDGVFSRFRPGSELNLVNESALPAVLVSPLFASVLGTALAAAEATGGLVDPTLGVAIEAAGYDRDFSRLGVDERPLGATAPGSWRALRLRGRVLSRPPGTRLDLNGVVKSLAVDEALRLVRS